MNEDFRSITTSANGVAEFLSQLSSVRSNLQSFIEQVSPSWRGRSFNNLVGEQSNCVFNCNNLGSLVSGLERIINLIDRHSADLSMKESLEAENERLYPRLYWYDSDGDEHINKSVQRRIRANERRISELIINLNNYVDEIRKITGGV